MSAYKQFNSSDIIISPLEVSKGYRSTIVPLISSSGGYSFITYGVGEYSQSLSILQSSGYTNQVERYLGQKIGFDHKENYSSGIYNSYKESSIYNSIKQLYYSNFISGSTNNNGDFVMSNASLPYFRPDGVVTGSNYNTIYDNYRQTDLLEQKTFPTASNPDRAGTPDIAVLSIPTNIFGDKIQPGSFRFNFGENGSSASGSFLDDGEGRVLSSSGAIVGNIIYTHGIIAITNPHPDKFGYGEQDYSFSNYGNDNDYSRDFFKGFISGSDLDVSISSSYTFFETQYKVTIGESEFNYSQNPSSISGSDGVPFNFITGSYFTPYVTTVGLYNDAHELLAVGKLAKPLPTSKTTDTTILINIDRH